MPLKIENFDERNFPDISYLLKKKIINYFLASSLILNRGPEFEKLYSQVSRLADKAVREYTWARESFLRQIESENNQEGSLHIVGIIDHLENCITTTQRVLRLWGRLRKHPLFKDETDKFKIKNAIEKDPVGNIRNIIEHVDEKIYAIEEGHGVCLMPNELGTGVEIADEEILFKDLASLLIFLNDLTRKLF